jgi:hypothetical protein
MLKAINGFHAHAAIKIRPGQRQPQGLLAGTHGHKFPVKQNGVIIPFFFDKILGKVPEIFRHIRIFH